MDGGQRGWQSGRCGQSDVGRGSWNRMARDSLNCNWLRRSQANKGVTWRLSVGDLAHGRYDRRARGGGILCDCDGL
ncbi:MAG: hypothetical protein JWN51_2215 [Phycisphaerales bacterium]|jgi:hypothetical protein|nr:hypothetical protein [Phycisphaerales bacterium]